MKNFVGSKNGNGVWQRIISEMPPHTIYIEAFAGTGIIGLRKKRSAATIYIDIDAAAPIFKTHGSSTLLSSILSGINDGSRIVPSDIYICGDAISQLSSLLPQIGSHWLIYFDPPYLRSTRSYQKRDYYKHEFDTLEQHLKLARFLVQLPCSVILSHPQCPLYENFLHHWRKILIPTITRGSARSTETVWMNYPEPFEFHDTRFLGKNFRERERIKRKRTRWIERLKSMSRLDRAAILDAINDLRSIHP